MASAGRSIAVVLFVLGTACGGSSTAPPSPSPSPDVPAGSTAITGREHLAWTQKADADAVYVFALYVDNVRNELTAATCTQPDASAYECDSALPSMSNGTHTLQLTATPREGGDESPRSAAIVVTVTR